MNAFPGWLHCALSAPALAIMWALGVLFLNACTAPESNSAISLPPTSHVEYSAAKATLEAGQAQAMNLAIQSTMVALNLSQAAATETHFLQQTARAQQETATALAQEATVTQAAHNATATASQQAYLQGQTQTAAVVQAQAAQATQTANAAHTATTWPQTATPLAATQQVIVAQAEAAQRRAQWEQILIPLQVIAFSTLGFAILVLFVLGFVKAYQRLLPALEIRLRTFRRGPHDAPLVFLDNLIIDPDRNFGPALHINHTGVQTAGLAPTPQLQERLVARDQAVDLARTQRMTTSRQRLSSLEPFVNINPEPASPVQIEIIEPQEVKPWLDEVEHKLLPQGPLGKE
jgi:hypothetical protein